MENGQNNNSIQLQARLNDPHIATVLNRLLDRIDALEQTVDTLVTAITQGPGMVSMVTDIADDTIRQAAAHGIDIEERLHNALALAEKLTAPAMTQQLEKTFTLIEQLPGMASMVTDIADDTIRQAAAHGIDIEERMWASLPIIEKATQPETLHSLDNLFETLLMAKDGMLSPEAVQLLGDAAHALVIGHKTPTKKAGLFDLLGALRDPNLQTALGFLLNFGRAFGETIESSS